MRTHDCEPTLNDCEVLDFCRKGVLMLEGVVPDEINPKGDRVSLHPRRHTT